MMTGKQYHPNVETVQQPPRESAHQNPDPEINLPKQKETTNRQTLFNQYTTLFQLTSTSKPGSIKPQSTQASGNKLPPDRQLLLDPYQIPMPESPSTPVNSIPAMLESCLPNTPRVTNTDVAAMNIALYDIEEQDNACTQQNFLVLNRKLTTFVTIDGSKRLLKLKILDNLVWTSEF